MPRYLVAAAPREALPITPLVKAELKGWLAGPGAALRGWVESTGFAAKPGELSLVPGRTGKLARVLVGCEAHDELWALAALPQTLPQGVYRLDAALAPQAATKAALGWALGTYRFQRYRKKTRPLATLAWPKGADRTAVERAADGIFLARDLINTPASDMGPAELAEAASALARRHRARIEVIEGERLLARNYPLIYAVGRASARAPRLIDLVWGEKSASKLTLVGKGVCFDSGGLDLKPASGMLIMKKDMGGAATMLGLASMVMAAGLPVRLRLLVPAVENSVSGNAMRPLDVVKSRKGITVEIGNTDAEGRLVLADALTEADSERPAMILDCATLTGAARAALGPELPALFSNDDKLANELLRHGEAEEDPLWRLPLWRPYRAMLESKTADINNISDTSFAGSVIAALFLEEFVSPRAPWVHIDSYAWNAKARPGRPEGGEGLAMRALFAMIAERFGGRNTESARANPESTESPPHPAPGKARLRLANPSQPSPPRRGRG
ncbi:MAG TPA: leucyl aminopeptidase family protein [Alphaproteobacteria bacterium]|nr:leucyl aminopeptidase family protein [Alphaproteobacteria bacterium]